MYALKIGKGMFETTKVVSEVKSCSFDLEVNPNITFINEGQLLCHNNKMAYVKAERGLITANTTGYFPYNFHTIYASIHANSHMPVNGNLGFIIEQFLRTEEADWDAVYNNLKGVKPSFSIVGMTAHHSFIFFNTDKQGRSSYPVYFISSQQYGYYATNNYQLADTLEGTITAFQPNKLYIYQNNAWTTM